MTEPTDDATGDVLESGDECERIAIDDLLRLESPGDMVLAQLLDVSDAELDGFVEGIRIGTLDLASFLEPGGAWTGSEAACVRAERSGLRNGLQVTSRKRSSGNSGSDHHTSQIRACAVDLSNGTGPTPQMLRTARVLAAAMGYSWPSNGYLQTATTARGYRAQLIYNSSVVPNHHNHVHFGVKKVR